MDFGWVKVSRITPVAVCAELCHKRGTRGISILVQSSLCCLYN